MVQQDQLEIGQTSESVSIRRQTDYTHFMAREKCALVNRLRVIKQDEQRGFT
jgi:hypothetical protein